MNEIPKKLLYPTMFNRLILSTRRFKMPIFERTPDSIVTQPGELFLGIISIPPLEQLKIL